MQQVQDRLNFKIDTPSDADLITKFRDEAHKASSETRGPTTNNRKGRYKPTFNSSKNRKRRTVT